VFAVGLLLTFRKSVGFVRTSMTAAGLWPLAYLTLLLLINLSESAILLLKQNTIFWLLYVATIFAMLAHDNRARGVRYARVFATKKSRQGATRASKKKV
jgi:O-antigen ligase